MSTFRAQGARFLIAVDTQPPWTALAARGPPAAAPEWGPPGGPARTIQVMLMGGLWGLGQHVNSRLLSGSPPSKEHAGPPLLQRPCLPSAWFSSSQPRGLVQRGTGLHLVPQLPGARVSSCEHSTDPKEPSGLALLQSGSQGGSLSAIITMVTAIDFCPAYPSGHLPFFAIL